jgi:hypothetical protein
LIRRLLRPLVRQLNRKPPSKVQLPKTQRRQKEAARRAPRAVRLVAPPSAPLLEGPVQEREPERLQAQCEAG